MVPSLHYIGGIEIHTVIASCLLSYSFSGVAGAIAHARKGNMNWPLARWICLGAIPGAAFGTVVVLNTNANLLVLLVGLFVGFAAVSVMLQKNIATNTYSTGSSLLFGVGAISGFGSALSGSGGPLVLVPLLAWLRWPVLLAVGLGQIIQVPVSIVASLVNLFFGQLDIALGLGIAIAVATGAWIGAAIAHWLPAPVLRRIVLCALTLVAGWMLINSGLMFLPARL